VILSFPCARCFEGEEISKPPIRFIALTSGFIALTSGLMALFDCCLTLFNRDLAAVQSIHIEVEVNQSEQDERAGVDREFYRFRVLQKKDQEAM
jgi:hypothetical protein